jgi:RND family efflux transporter MFP subunit
MDRRIQFIVCIMCVALTSLATPTDAQLTKTFTQPFEISDVAAAESGVIAEIRVREGDVVRKGDTLGILNIEVFVETEKLAQMRANSTARIDAAQSILKLRQSKLTNLDSLVKEGHVNPFEVDQAKSQFESAQADYRLAVEESQESKLEVAKIRAQIAARTIRSPIDGVVTNLHKHLGEYVASNDPKFATVVQLNKLKANFYLDAANIQQMKHDQQVNIVVGANAVPSKARISYLSPIIDPTTGTGRIEIEIDNENGKHLSGVICQLHSVQTAAGIQTITNQTTQQRKRGTSNLMTNSPQDGSAYR